MAEFLLEPRSGLEGVAAVGHHGRRIEEAGVTLALRRDLALASVMARKGCLQPLAARIQEAFGVALPQTPRRAAAAGIAFTWAGPGHWLASSETQAGDAFEARLADLLGGLAAVADQSDGRSVIRVGGPRAREALGKGVLIDLHPRAFGPGDAAVTTIAHIGAHFWQVDDAPSYEFTVSRSFAADFWRWLVAAAAEFGVNVAAG